MTIPHFPSRLHAYVWRNWQLVPVERLAQVVGAQPADIVRLGRAMGLPTPRPVGEDQWRRSLITIIRRNWHLLPYGQLLALVGWTEEQLAFALREDDFLFIKLGSLKPSCAPLSYRDPDEGTLRRMMEIAAIVRREFPGEGDAGQRLFSFVDRLSQPTPPANVDGTALFAPRFCYSYFALYGDPLLAEEADLYPDGYLAQLAACGVEGVWLPAVLHTLAPFPWDAGLSARYEERVRALQRLAERARRHGMGVYLYLNEPRALPLPFYDAHPALRGVAEDGYAALCTSVPDVQRYITAAVASICRATPDLAGILTITASENLTNCWSHRKGEHCPRCERRTGAEVIAEVDELIHEGIRQSGNGTRLLIWDWGWPDEWAESIINRLPVDATLVSVSEWGLPISRGGVDSVVGEYTLSAIGPGPRATSHWALARQRGLSTIAKIQAASTWELSALPYIPVVETTAQHIATLRTCQVDGLMLGWTLGGYPSPNLEVVAAMGRSADVTPAMALEEVARRRFGDAAWRAVVQAWHIFSQAFGQFPFHVNVVYRAPLYVGPANPLWEAPTGYEATMLGFPYDDLDGWRGIYPPDVFARQLEAVASGFQPGVAALQQALRDAPHDYRSALQEELNVAEAASLHLRSAARQARFVMARDALSGIRSVDEAHAHLDDIERMLHEEIDDAHRLYAIQSADARIGFEASNQYYYVPMDLIEKVVNCYDLLDRWLPAQRAHWQEGHATTGHLGLSP